MLISQIPRNDRGLPLTRIPTYTLIHLQRPLEKVYFAKAARQNPEDSQPSALPTRSKILEAPLCEVPLVDSPSSPWAALLV